MKIMVRRLALACVLSAAAVVPPVAAADTSPVATDPPELPSIRTALKAKQYQPALAQLKVLVVKYQTPGVFSLMGFALRKTGDRPQAMTYYNKALAMDPTHRGALEYQGELFVELGQLDKAKENLAKLKRQCLFGCEEADDLKEAIEHAPRGG